jgi:hypothetical protein
VSSFVIRRVSSIRWSKNTRVMQKIFNASSLGYNGDPFNKDDPLISFLEGLDTQCVRFRHQESELYPMEQKYGGSAKNN